MMKIKRPLPRQHWASIGPSENGQPMGVTIDSDFLRDMSCSPTCRRWVAVNWEKNPQFLTNAVYVKSMTTLPSILTTVRLPWVSVLKLK